MSGSFCCRKSSVIEFYEKRLEDSIKSFIPLSYHPGGSETTRRLIEKANIGGNSIVLDVASGVGETAIYIATNFGSSVIGIDLSRKMVDYANVFAKTVGLDQKISFIIADAERIPLRDNFFDAAISECTLCLVPDMLRVLCEMRRVIKPGAKVVISDIVLVEKLPIDLANTVLYSGCITGAKTLNDYILSFEKAGLKNIEVEDVTKIVIDQIHQFLKEEINYNETNSYSPSLNYLEQSVRDLQRISINLWLAGKIKYYIVSGVK
ncbi:MAG: methyltransferase domain-containing protein [Candidatus Bathyarchaeia archaeon]